MKPGGIYLDEDVQSGALIEALRARGLTVLTTSEAGNTSRSDNEQLAFASSKNLVLATSNISDFAELHRRWMSSQQHHAGIVLIQQQKLGPGELARRIVRVLAAAAEHGMIDQLEFLSAWH